eukprot:GEMP01076801.1.p1 GENE.GEMP01076801.1~~GEMP01076801.1.p1  ORF type:complete len:142 (-),score=18.13 GEMP01076801.1:35-460(-)
MAYRYRDINASHICVTRVRCAMKLSRICCYRDPSLYPRIRHMHGHEPSPGEKPVPQLLGDPVLIVSEKSTTSVIIHVGLASFVGEFFRPADGGGREYDGISGSPTLPDSSECAERDPIKERLLLELASSFQDLAMDNKQIF